MAITENYKEFFRFCIVGILCTGIDAAIFYIVILFASYPVALSCGYLLSLAVNYFLTACWTFKVAPNRKNAIGIITAHLFNLFVVRMGVISLLVNVMHIDERIAYMPTLTISVITNFIIIKLVINRLK